MYKRSLDDKIIGVLNDFDLAIISETRSSNTERTGTMPFMALDVLEGIANSDPRPHLYRYDAESFLWVAVWVCGTFEHGKERKNPPFKDWTQGDAHNCRLVKLGFLDGSDSPWSGDHSAKDEILQDIRYRLWKDRVERVEQARRIQKVGGEVESKVPESPETTYERMDTKLFSKLREQLRGQGMDVD